MPRLNVVEVDAAVGRLQALYAVSQQTFGKTFNLFKGLANSPLALEAYITLERLLLGSKLTPAQRDIVRLVASQFNECEYCLRAHTVTAKMNGLSEDEILEVCRGEADDPQHAALVRFTNQVLETKGRVQDGDITRFRQAGYSDAHIAEIVTILAQKTLSNFFNHIHETRLDVPPAEKP
jgi:uncharacterized peroxidase-related enzyme